MTNATDDISKQIEDLLVARNPRGMKTVQPALEPGYYARAARLFQNVTGHVLIGTGFPVGDTFETDGPVGAIALYQTLEKMGATPILVTDQPLSGKLANDYRVIEISAEGDQKAAAIAQLERLKPEVVLAIERPGQAADGHYYNIRGINIASRTACFDHYIREAKCPTVGIGDGGNEIGMGNIVEAISGLDIVPAATCVNELLLADVSNWGAYGLIALWGYWRHEDLLAQIDPQAILAYCSSLGSVDGITHRNEMTEDNLPLSVGLELIANLRKVTGFND